MAARAVLDLGGAGAWRAAHGRRDARRAIPANAPPLIECDLESLVRLLSPCASAVRPVEVSGSRPVASLAADADLRPRRMEGIGARVEVLQHVRRVAVRALVIPVLVDAGPVQPVARLDGLPRIKMKPALAALPLGARIPGDRQRLQPAARHGDQVLLERFDAEGVQDPVIVQPPIRAVGRYVEFVAAPRRTST